MKTDATSPSSALIFIALGHLITGIMLHLSPQTITHVNFYAAAATALLGDFALSLIKDGPR